MSLPRILSREADGKLFRFQRRGHWSTIVSSDGEGDYVKFYGPGYVGAHSGHSYVAVDNPGRYLLDKYGITCAQDNYYAGPGWTLLVEDLIRKLIAAGWDRQLCQVKEKFGGLRFYIVRTSDELDRLVEDAENDSFFTCEECGNPGETRATSGGWEYTSCAEHKKDRRPA